MGLYVTHKDKIEVFSTAFARHLDKSDNIMYNYNRKISIKCVSSRDVLYEIEKSWRLRIYYKGEVQLFIVKANDNMEEWVMTNEEKDILISKLTEYLPTLRGTVKESQEQIANAIGVSRQTYNSIELKKRKMSWNTYMALVFFYDQQPNSHVLLRKLDLFPNQITMPDAEAKDISDPIT